MLLSLDDAAALDPGSTGSKVAWLARGRQAGLPVLPGVVVPCSQAAGFLELGAATLGSHGSGRARMAITASALPEQLVEELRVATEAMSAPMVVRSSSALEESGVWSGAFTSYLDIRHDELPKAVLGCYASAFTQATVERFEGAGVAPTAAALAVLVQPALEPRFGGTARLVGDEVVVVGVEGSPVPLVQGWDPGVQAKVDDGGVVRGATAIDTLGEELIGRVASALRLARQRTGANSCEWAVEGDTLWLLQLQRFTADVGASGIPTIPVLGTDPAASAARMIRRFPGPLGASLVLPWALADSSLADVDPAPPALDPYDALFAAVAQASALTAEVWGKPKPVAAAQSGEMLRSLRGPDPGEALAALAGLRPPERGRATELLGLLAVVRRGLVQAGAVGDVASAWHVDEAKARAWLSGSGSAGATTRIGFDRWEPFNAAVVVAHGDSISGTSAAPGVAFGRLCAVINPASAEHFRPRDVLVGVHPVPGLAALLFDAAALITTGGGPAAHLFESARSLGIPAVCATRIEDLIGGELGEVTTEWALAVDGTSGSVHAVEW